MSHRTGWFSNEQVHRAGQFYVGNSSAGLVYARQEYFPEGQKPRVELVVAEYNAFNPDGAVFAKDPHNINAKPVTREEYDEGVKRIRGFSRD